MYATLVAYPIDTCEGVVATAWTPKMMVLAGTWHWVRITLPPVGIAKLLVVRAPVATALAETKQVEVPELVITRSRGYRKVPAVAAKAAVGTVKSAALVVNVATVCHWTEMATILL